MGEEPSFDHRALLELADMRMPFGRYAGQRLIDLPEPYVVWFARQGFPPGKLGEMLQTVYEIKVNGLEYLFAPLRGKTGGAGKSSRHPQPDTATTIADRMGMRD